MLGYGLINGSKFGLVACCFPGQGACIADRSGDRSDSCSKCDRRRAYVVEESKRRGNKHRASDLSGGARDGHEPRRCATSVHGGGRQQGTVVGRLEESKSEPAQAKENRDPHQRALFVKQHPCPATGKTRGACPGYIVDHIRPLCAGGADHSSNMQWQTVADGKVKDRNEREMCRNRRLP